MSETEPSLMIIQHVDSRIKELKTDISGQFALVNDDVSQIRKDVRMLLEFRWKVAGVGILMGSVSAVAFEAARMTLDYFLNHKVGG